MNVVVEKLNMSILNEKKKFSLRKHLMLFLVCFVFSGLFVLYSNIAQNVKIIQPPVMLFNMYKYNYISNIWCHKVDENDALPSAEDRNFLPRPNSIFFHETSCRGGLNSRQACAVESAARAHPGRQVYVMFSGPVSEAVYEGSSIAKLRRFANIRFARVHITDYARNTPLERMSASGIINKSWWPVEHSSDVMRFLTLYKWGGMYLDTDFVVVKSLTPLGYNWIARESNWSASSAALAISMDHIGRKFAEYLINDIKTNFQPNRWSANGPDVVSRALGKMCNTSEVMKWSAITCQGLEVYGPEYFYPIHHPRHGEYFKPGELKNVEKAHAHHFWNKLSFDDKIEKDSPYENMAKQYCPTIYKMYGEEFGSVRFKWSVQ